MGDYSIISVLMRRDGMTRQDAEELITEAWEDLQDRLAVDEPADDICEEWFGLEPDYIFDLIDWGNNI